MSNYESAQNSQKPQRMLEWGAVVLALHLFDFDGRERAVSGCVFPGFARLAHWTSVAVVCHQPMNRFSGVLAALVKCAAGRWTNASIKISA
jgi:hypothetical protein